jgi:large subunit ribosomal protein L10
VDRAQKKEFVTGFHDVLKGSEVVVVAHYAGLSVAQMTKFRRQMKEAGGTVKVAKNRLARLALQGTPSAGIAELFKGPTVVAISKDPVSAAKVAVTFAKENEKLVILGGAMGSTVLDRNGVKALAELPSLDALRAQILGLLQAPASRIARLVKEPGAGLARVISARATEGEKAA